jgi:hypothetical protein
MDPFAAFAMPTARECSNILWQQDMPSANNSRSGKIAYRNKQNGPLIDA